MKASEKIAILRRSGARKSSLVNLLPGFYEPISGQILIDRQNIHEVQ